MPDKTVTQDKFNGTCDITMTLSVEETRLWRNMTPASRQALVGKFTELLGAELPEIQAALSQAIIPVGADEAVRQQRKKQNRNSLEKQRQSTKPLRTQPRSG